MSFFGKRFYSWLDSSSFKEKGNKAVAGNSSVRVVGDLEGEKQSCV